jgi:hypothetical protein
MSGGSNEAGGFVPGGVPKVALLVAAVSMFALTVALVVALTLAGRLDAQSTPLVVTLVGFTTTLLPGLFAAVFAERAARDIRNGVVVDRAREGAAQAIRDEQVVTRTGPVVSTELAALAELVGSVREQRAAMQANTDALRQIHGVPDRRKHPRPPSTSTRIDMPGAQPGEGES